MSLCADVEVHRCWGPNRCQSVQMLRHVDVGVHLQ